MDGDVDFLRGGIEVLTQALIELEATERIGAEKYERTPERTTYRNGYRERLWDTRVGRVNLRIKSCGRGASSPDSCSRAAGPSRPCCQWSRKPMSTASAPARWTNW